MTKYHVIKATDNDFFIEEDTGILFDSPEDAIEAVNAWNHDRVLRWNGWNCRFDNGDDGYIEYTVLPLVQYDPKLHKMPGVK